MIASYPEFQYILRNWEMYWSQVEIAQRMEWPQTSEEHMALVRGISSHEWLSCLRESDMGMLLDEDDWPIAPIADFELETRYGPRRFHVWKPPWSRRDLDRKAPKPRAHGCDMRVDSV